MIYFACKQCGKKHSRPEGSAGTMVFCACGQGNLVPWESTASAPPVDLPAGPPPAPPGLDPVRFDAPPSGPASRRPGRRRRRYVAPRRDPNHCFNHEGKAQQGPCDDCGEPFCENCLVTFQEKRLCGPCKNYRLWLAQRPPATSFLALLSLFLALGTGPVAMCLFPLHKVAVGFVLALQALAVVLAIVSLWQAESNPRIGGQSLAWTGLVTAAVAGVFNVLLAVYAPRMLM